MLRSSILIPLAVVAACGGGHAASESPTPTPTPTVTTLSPASEPPPAPAAVDASPDGMVLVPAGTFEMGSNTGSFDEKPVHAVHVDAFHID